MPTFTSELTTTVTGAPKSIFPLPPVDSTYFSGTDTDIQVELNGTVLVNPTHWTETPAGYATLVTPAAVGSTVRITRSTVPSSPLVTASSPVMFSVTMFNKGMWQLLYLIQELWAQVNKCLSWIVNGAGELVWDFQSRRGANCADPVDAQDVTTKGYVDAADSALNASLRSYIDIQDTATLAAAQLYTRLWFPSISYVSGTNIPVVPSSQVVPAGTTRIWFPVPIYTLVLTVNGVSQSTVADFTFTPGLNYVDMAVPFVIQSTINAFIISSTSAQFISESVAYVAGDTLTTMPSAFDGGLVFLNGVLQVIGVDYTHIFGTTDIAWLSTSSVDGVVQVIRY